MSKIINCECGHVVRGETDEELVANADEHIRAAHPELVGQITREQVLAMAEEA